MRPPGPRVSWLAEAPTGTARLSPSAWASRVPKPRGSSSRSSRAARELLRGVVVHRGGEERLAHGLAADPDQPRERLVLLPGRRRQVALARELGVAQHGGRAQELLDLFTVVPDERVHSARGRGRLA